LRPRKVNYAFIHSSTSALRGAIRQIVTIVHSENTGSIANGTTRSLKSSEKSTLTQFTYLWVGVILKIFSQNACKNKLLIDILLENNKEFDIIFIQESP